VGKKTSRAKSSSTKKAAKKSAKKVAKKGAKKTAKKVVKRAAKKTAKKVVKKAAKKTAKKVVKKAAKKTAKKVVKKAAKKTAKKTAKKVVKKAAKKTAKKVVKKAAKKTAKKVVKEADEPKPQAPKRKKLKSPLKKAQLNRYRKMLLEKRKALLGDMSGIAAGAFRGGNGGGDLSSMPTHPADIGSDNYEQEFSLGLLESERALLEEIDDALARIEDRTYGVCVGTGNPIGIPRLNARPWSKYGIEYARMVEQGLIRPGDPVMSDDDDEDF
jgi:RNA polymerase-binding protein DksA